MLRMKARQKGGKSSKNKIYMPSCFVGTIEMTGSAYNRGGISMEAFLWHPLSITCEEGGTYACSLEEPAHQHLQDPTLLLPPRLRRQNENPNSLLVGTLVFFFVFVS